LSWWYADDAPARAGEEDDDDDDPEAAAAAAPVRAERLALRKFIMILILMIGLYLWNAILKYCEKRK